MILLCALPKMEVKAQVNFNDENSDLNSSFEYISVLALVEGYENFYLDIIFNDDELLFINIQELFLALNIPCKSEQNGQSLSGFIDIESNSYLIDYNKKQIKVGSKIFKFENEIVKETGALYMLSSFFDEVFGIGLTFNFRSMTLVLKSDFELPALKMQRLDKMRNNISKVQGEITADTVLQRNYHLFKFGMLDWSLASYQNWNGSTDNFLGIGLGTELLYGQAEISINYYDKYEFDPSQINYRWRWVDNTKSLIKQAQIGKISSQTISFLESPLVGAVIRNSPTTIRKASGYYTITEFTEPNWTVELYINNVMVDYTSADASGLFEFKVPIVYGYTTLKLEFYGPMGEERTEERIINMPYTIMPTNELEYSLTAGIVQDSTSSRFGRAEFNYGVNRFITVGGGLEYLSSLPNSAFIPFFNATIQPYSKLTLNAEYAHGVKARALLDYYFWKNALLVLDYTKYVEGQLAIRFNALSELKVKFTKPFKYKKISGLTQFEFMRFGYKTFSFNQANIIFSTYYKRFNASSSTKINWIDNGRAFFLSDLALSYRMKKGFVLRPSTQYNINTNNIIAFKISLEKSIPKGYITAGYERNIMSDDNLLSLSFKYDLTYAKINSSISHRDGGVYTSESIQGSLALGSGNNYIHKSNNTSLGKGGISLHPFLDLNQNGIFDDDEYPVKVNAIKVTGGEAFFSEKDSIVRIADLLAFTDYIIEFNDYELENISWRFKNKTYKVLIDPNQFKRIDVPVITVGEVSGMAYRKINNSISGIARILVNIYKKNETEVVAKTLSEYDGYTYYLGLSPGKYVARVDSIQLRNLGLTAEPPEIDFTIKSKIDGDIVDGIDFTLLSLQKDSIYKIESELELASIDISDQTSPITDSLIYKSSDTLYRVQLLALSKPLKDDEYFSQLIANVPGLVIESNLEDDSLYHFSSKQVFNNKNEANKLKNTIKGSGWKDCFVVTFIKEKGTLAKLDNILNDSDSITNDSITNDSIILATVDTIYKIQLLALSKPLKIEDQFTSLMDSIPDLTIKEYLEKDSLYHYTSSQEFHRKSKARELLKSIRENGWVDSFIVFYTSGKRIETISPLKLDDSVIRDNLAFMPNDTLYKVQLLASKRPFIIKDYFAELLSDIPELTIEEILGEDGLYRYSTGNLKNLDIAKKTKEMIIQSGWESCFISTYTTGKGDAAIRRIKIYE